MPQLPASPLGTRAIWSAAAIFGLLAASISAAPQGAAAPAPATTISIWDGVFTQAQAARGREQFSAHCTFCHGDDLTGADGPGLVGGNFRRNWGSRYLDKLYKKIRERMPAEDVSSVSDADKLDITAFLLSMNGFPAGKSELTTDPAHLAAIQIVGKNGPEPAPTGATVEVIGCLAQDGNGWKLVNAIEPVVSSLDDPAGDAAAALGRAMGTQTIRLLDVFPKPDAHKGHRMMAKGLLIRADSGTQLNVLALEMVAPSCAP